MNRTCRIGGGLACLLVGLTSIPAMSSTKAAPPKGTSFRVRYGISLIGLPIGSASITGTLDPQAYKLDAAGKLTGLAGVIINSKGGATATGSFAAGQLSPATFAATAATTNYVLTIRMAMAKGNATGVDISPPYQAMPDRIALTDADRRGIVDPLSAFIMTVPGAGDVIGPAACDRTMRLFDGGVRFDIILSYSGIRQVKGAGYTGPVAVCAARYKPIAGHRPNRPATKFMTNNKEIELWLAPLGDGRVVFPYRLSVLSMIGTTVIEATDLQTSGKKAASNPE